jgi:SAM-dependent methyltransferase
MVLPKKQVQMDAGLRNGDGFSGEYYSRYRINPFKTVFGAKPGVLRQVRKMAPRGRLLDLGCGLGEFMAQAARYFQVWGLERSLYAASEAAKLKDLTGRLVVGEAGQHLPFRQGSFSVVSLMDLVEHLERPERLIEQAAELLAPGGLLVLSTPNLESLGRVLKGNQWAGARDRTHVSVMPPKYWEEVVGRHLVVEKVLYDGLWDSPYFFDGGFWKRPGLRGLVGLSQSLIIVLPFLVLNKLGLGSPRRLGENLWIFARKQ